MSEIVRVFDRIPSFDPKSRNYPIRALLTPTTPRSYTWSCTQVLDQGSEGACVGFGWAGELQARPVVVPTSNMRGFQLYNEAKRLDEWEGENYEGTSVLAGAKAVLGHGFMDEYRWAFSLQDALIALGYHGPIVTGFMWKEGMLEPDSEGWIHYTGRDVGGHCTVWRAVNVTHRGVLVQNSWGLEWGMNGCAHMSWDDFAAAMANEGEVCVPVRRDKVGTW